MPDKMTPIEAAEKIAHMIDPEPGMGGEYLEHEDAVSIITRCVKDQTAKAFTAGFSAGGANVYGPRMPAVADMSKCEAAFAAWREKYGDKPEKTA